MNPSVPASLALVALLATLPAAAGDPTKQECVAADDAAQDLRQQGKLRAAREKLAICTTPSCPALVREDCGQRIQEIERIMPTVVFEATDPAGNDLAAVRVSIDGKHVADQLDGTAMALDPGEHRLAFEAEGHPTVEKAVVVREGDKHRRVRVVLGGGASDEAPAKREATAGASETPAASPDGSGQRTVGLVLGGAGIAAGIVGTILGLVAKSTYEQASPACRNGSGPCSGADQTHGTDAHGQAATATAAFIAAGALLGGGVVVYLTAPRASVTVSPSVGASAAGLRVEARW